jgi:hypothetical protein
MIVIEYATIALACLAMAARIAMFMPRPARIARKRAA